MKLVIVSSAALASAFMVSLAAQGGGKTTWDGVYSTAQAARGQAIYADKCAKCHGAEGTGGDAPDLVGSGFASDFGGTSLNDIVQRIKTSMPADGVGSLSTGETVDIFSHMLDMNGFPPGGADLASTSAVLSGIKYVATKPAAAALIEPDDPPPPRVRAAGVLDAPDPAQMETAPALGFTAVKPGLRMPADFKMGAPAAVAFDKNGHLFVFNRGTHPLVEFDAQGAFVRSFGEGQYVRPHGMRIDADGNIWLADVNAHTVTKVSAAGTTLLTLGTKGQSGKWDEAAGTHLLFEPCDIAFAPNGDVFVVEGHGRGEGTVLKFDKSGTLLTQWGKNGKGDGEFDQPHSLIVRDNLLYVADRENHRVQIFDLNGKFQKIWTFAGLPCGLLNGPDGQVYLTSGFSGQVLKLDTNGKPVGAFGQAGPGLADFGEAHYMAFAPNGDIYVADTINQVLHRYARR
ncbi:MAG TPA: c-type cytochrome [Vicinamibacterales bacterium]|jgi:sugar lactone lactonase YvrE|nr:c-type cytochrome [Vicinamibacterales bacterium]